MSINSQFFRFYIDELVKVHWVDWSEKYLSKLPDQSFSTRRGFQEITGSESSSTVRTRALDCYKLGLISAKLISSRSGGSSGIPKGWSSICEDEAIHSNIGYISYVIGKGLRQTIVKPSVNSALNSIASLLILSIGFNYNERWYTTYFIYSFVREKAEKEFNKSLSNDELRILAGAVFNTLEFGHIDQLINAYKLNSDDFNLFFKYRDGGGERLFPISKFVEVYSEQGFNINHTEQHKACLFWANPERGIYSRAISSAGHDLLHVLASHEHDCLQSRKPNFLSEFYEGTENNDSAPDLLDLLFRHKSNINDITRGLKKVMKSLNDGVIDSLDLIKKEADVVTTEKFYLHDEIALNDSAKTIEFNIKISDIPLLPSVGHSLFLTTGEELSIIDVSADDDEVKITANRTQ
jgi:hypothetical protein